ncbi:DoxX family protein [Rhizobium multihospitium]|uniref:Putative oxidoreductase n=1 Tax=Rhizobium multihospitium TaxID=410764 RepID=A0A1C3XDF5_9HYPH|nr:DoxX family protein [Rhizobium multihospitium]SCB50268.1 putative oxidoreductase [Rhizobium multihospitium]
MSALTARAEQLTPYFLSVFRIVAGLLFLQHGLVKFLGWPALFPIAFAPFSQLWFAGMIECAGGILLIVGLFSRWAAVVCSGEMAFAYFLFHQSKGLTPIQNGGDLAIMFCFAFLLLAVTGPGPLSIDARRHAPS